MKVRELIKLLLDQDLNLDIFVEGSGFIDGVEECEEAHGKFVAIRKH